MFATLNIYTAQLLLQKMLGLHLVLVTLHGHRFTISIEQDKTK